MLTQLEYQLAYEQALLLHVGLPPYHLDFELTVLEGEFASTISSSSDEWGRFQSLIKQHTNRLHALRDLVDTIQQTKKGQLRKDGWKLKRILKQIEKHPKPYRRIHTPIYAERICKHLYPNYHISYLHPRTLVVKERTLHE